uniref:Uncharacterized protein n=1 Tax=Ananas comosus var. bracteatus TaxID=296719 RepID=A0A6V7PYB5_ANACO|nr:unnamed protein product [Ananas comosus var. bracteatus]
MTKAIPRIGSRRNGRIGSRRVLSWASAGTSGFKGTRRGTPYAAQAAAVNAIRTVVDQGQADTIGIAMRRALLGEIEGRCITRAKSEKKEDLIEQIEERAERGSSKDKATYGTKRKSHFGKT